MCLIINKGEIAKTADAPIKCIKIMIKKYSSDHKHYTYHPVFNSVFDFDYAIGRISTSARPRPMPKESGSVYIIDEGLHSFLPDVYGWKKLAKWIKKSFSSFFKEWKNIPCEVVAIECEIPVGAVYYKGIHNCIDGTDDEMGYVSDKLLPVREIPNEEWRSNIFQ